MAAIKRAIKGPTTGRPEFAVQETLRARNDVVFFDRFITNGITSTATANLHHVIEARSLQKASDFMCVLVAFVIMIILWDKARRASPMHVRVEDEAKPQKIVNALVRVTPRIACTPFRARR